MDEKDKKKPGSNKPKKEKQKFSKSIAFWLVLGLMVLGFIKVSEDLNNNFIEIPYTLLNQIVKDDKIGISKAEVTLSDGLYVFKGQIPNGSLSSELRNKIGLAIDSNKDFKFKAYYPSVSEKMLETWEARGIQVNFRPVKVGLLSVLFGLWPIFLMVGLYFFMFRSMQGGGGAGGGRGIFSFGKSKAKKINEDRPKNSFADVAGCDEAKLELEEIIDFLKDPKKFTNLGGKIPKGALLVGSPGTGKTLLARAVAGEADVPFFSMSGSDFVEMFVGVGASRVRDLFEQGKKSAPCIIFIDEIDAVGRHRGAGVGGGHDEREQTLNQLLVEMDGFETNEGVILIAATNRPDVLDPALLRPGRFDRQVVVDKPDIKGREAILKIHTRKIPLDDTVNLNIIARGTPGLSGADLANLMNEAALLAARFNQKKVTMLDIEEARDKVMMGNERRSMVLSDKEKKTTAYHEAGHALGHVLLPLTEPLHKVTIIPRGMALGITFSIPEEDRHTLSKSYIMEELICLLAGRVAEEIMFDEFTTGASNDIERTTGLVRKMVCEWGMTEELGPISFGKKDEQIFLGREINQHKDFSDKTAERIDDIVHSIILERLEATKVLLLANKDKLILLGDALVEHELLDGEEVEKILAGEKLELAKKTRVHIPKRKPKSKVKDSDTEKESNKENTEKVKEEVSDKETESKDDDEKKGDNFDSNA